MRLTELKKDDIFILDNEHLCKVILTESTYVTLGKYGKDVAVKITYRNLVNEGLYEVILRDIEYNDDSSTIKVALEESEIEATFLMCFADEEDEESVYVEFMDLNTYEAFQINCKYINYDLNIEEGNSYKLTFIDKFLISAIPC